MNKYQEFSSIVQQHFNSDLKQLDFDYLNDDSINIIIEYKDNFYSYSYELQVKADRKNIEFIKHNCVSRSGQSRLKRNIEFEQGVEDYLLNH